MMKDGHIWDKPYDAMILSQEYGELSNELEHIDSLNERIDELIGYCELFEDLSSLEDDMDTIHEEVKELEFSTLLVGEYNKSNAIVYIHSGAGGTESQYWVEQLQRMYLKWADRKNFMSEIYHVNYGEIDGIKDIVIKIAGNYAYGFLQSEHGVHRLSRISTYDSSRRRHTSFASVEVMPELEYEEKIDIDETDILFETFKAQGKGGQHINKTESAVRLRHIPTGIVVECQNERSQHQNKSIAMNMLQSRLFQLKQKEHEEKLDKLRGEKADIAFGSRIRTYVFNPYTLVKDHRTDYETSNITNVMNGDIDEFMYRYLLYKRSKE